VGWFTSMYPVRLDLDEAGADEVWSGTGDPARAVQHISRRLEALPGNGIGYGLLRYLGERIDPTPGTEPQIRLNYLGRFGGSATENGAWETAPEAAQLRDAAHMARPMTHSLEINAMTLDTAEGPRLTVTWTWPTAVLDDGEADDLIDTWLKALALLANGSATGEPAPTSTEPAPLINLSAGELDRLASEWGDAR